MTMKTNTNFELDTTSGEESIDQAESSADQELATFKQMFATLSFEMLSACKAVIEEELVRRRREKVDQAAEFFKTLSPEERAVLLNSIQGAGWSPAEPADARPPRSRREKNPLRMYQNFPDDENPEYKVAPLVNLELQEVFIGGNPNNKTWLAGLPVEERYERYGTIERLKQDANFLDSLMTVPKAVFRQEEGHWVDCYQA